MIGWWAWLASWVFMSFGGERRVIEMGMLVFVSVAAAAWLGLKWVFKELEAHLDSGDDHHPD
ncbi:ribose ABC superfamily ATP binding cassette transporter, membrane protein [Neisseria wadsworthii 9715]|uniref:Ribose ABC superfamily ATP binding cassette transporter, membrane protein n=1 Tax=Neisseria wadsworthii 9715 TaxID=1030841 RepID=G4CPK1_9NEIS|nr:ribose ABC superfamily ATP binding cassette transporter, membrane protein [Neisseria wadsworthii 9715]